MNLIRFEHILCPSYLSLCAKIGTVRPFRIDASIPSVTPHGQSKPNNKKTRKKTSPSTFGHYMIHIICCGSRQTYVVRLEWDDRVNQPRWPIGHFSRLLPSDSIVVVHTVHTHTHTVHSFRPQPTLALTHPCNMETETPLSCLYANIFHRQSNFSFVIALAFPYFFFFLVLCSVCSGSMRWYWVQFKGCLFGHLSDSQHKIWIDLLQQIDVVVAVFFFLFVLFTWVYDVVTTNDRCDNVRW